VLRVVHLRVGGLLLLLLLLLLPVLRDGGTVLCWSVRVRLRVRVRRNGPLVGDRHAVRGGGGKTGGG
jgi:hypothetical protein